MTWYEPHLCRAVVVADATAITVARALAAESTAQYLLYHAADCDEWFGRRVDDDFVDEFERAMHSGRHDVEHLLVRLPSAAAEQLTSEYRAGVLMGDAQCLVVVDGGRVAVLEAVLSAAQRGKGGDRAVFRDVAARSSREASPGAEDVDDRRLGVDAYADGHHLEHALIAGQVNKVLVSIGRSATAQVEEPIGLDFGDADLLALPVRFDDGETEQHAVLEVPRDPATTAFVSFQVLPRSPTFVARIVVYAEDGRTVVEAARLEADVVAHRDAERTAPASIRLRRVQVSPASAAAADQVGSVVSDRDRTIVSGEIPIPADQTGAVYGVAPVLSIFRTEAGNFVAKKGRHDIRVALVAAAQFGFRMRRSLRLDVLKDMDRIQVVSLYPASVFPLELVYDGRPPADDATVCEAWSNPDDDGECPVCRNADDGRIVCPLRFWGLRKVIEHHVHSTTGNVTFAARHLPEPGEAITMPTRSLVGLSARVVKALARSSRVAADDGEIPEEGQPSLDPAASLGEELPDALRRLGSYSVARDWTDWRARVGADRPELLIVMPHQDGGVGAIPSLELGGQTSTTVLAEDVRYPGAVRGPIVLLLGCDTSNAPDMLASFASDMRDEQAVVVVGTIGRVIAAEAPHVAATIVEHLRRADHDHATIAEALVSARRTLLGESRLIGLQLILHGDARWELAS